MNVNRPYVRQKRKPPKGARCDAAGVDESGVHLKRCPNDAAVEFKGGPFPFETWLCDTCAANIERLPPPEAAPSKTPKEKP